MAGRRLRRALRGPREDDDDEQTFWREYLLYHRSEGFAFLVDAEDGWSWARADHRRAAGRSATASRTRASLYQQALRLHRQGHLRARRVLLAADARPAHRQHRLRRHRRGGGKRLNRERTEGEGTQRGRLVGRRDARRRRGAEGLPPRAPTSAPRCSATPLPTTFSGASLLAKIFFWIFIVVVVLMLFRCGSGGGKADCSETAQHLRRGVAGVPELPRQPAQRQRLSQRRRLVRRLFERRRPQVAARARHASVRSLQENSWWIEWLKPGGHLRLDPLRADRRARLLALLRHHRQAHALQPVGGDRREAEHRAGDRGRRRCASPSA